MKSRSVNRLRAVSLFSFRFSESNARARERRSRETPSVTRVAICVCRVLLDGPQKKVRPLVVYSVKRNAKNAWGLGERQGSLPFFPPPPPPFPSRTCLIFRSARFNTIPTILAESLAQAKKTEAETGCNEEYGGRYTIICYSYSYGNCMLQTKSHGSRRINGDFILCSSNQNYTTGSPCSLWEP